LRELDRKGRMESGQGGPDTLDRETLYSLTKKFEPPRGTVEPDKRGSC